jgi:equilibrative nucleoside transporter 1/2/3
MDSENISILLQPQNKGWVVAMMSVLRIAFIPLLLLCNAQPRHHLPVVMNSDLYYILIIVLFGLSNGYLANIALICVPK